LHVGNHESVPISKYLGGAQETALHRINIGFGGTSLVSFEVMHSRENQKQFERLPSGSPLFGA
jgi:hypothetical protein